MIHRFQYLTQDVDSISHQELAEIACKNGIRWLQLRVKNKPFDTYLSIANDVKKICNKWNCILIINDNVEICKAIDAHGVHLGKNDMVIAEARKIVGSNKIIGGTANTIEDIERIEKQGIDYIGLGPYKFTNTKENLSSVIGLDGYQKILHSTIYNIKKPVIAIGGIQLTDIKPLMNTGIHGIAVSSAINLSTKKEVTISAFLKHFSAKDTSHIY